MSGIELLSFQKIGTDYDVLVTVIGKKNRFMIK